MLTFFTLPPELISEKDSDFYPRRTDTLKMMDHFGADYIPALSESIADDEMRREFSTPGKVDAKTGGTIKTCLLMIMLKIVERSAKLQIPEKQGRPVAEICAEIHIYRVRAA